MSHKPKTLQKFIEQAREIHGSRYSYESCVYKDSTVKVNVTCDKHGVFSVSPPNHLLGTGCVKCFRDSKRKTISKFVERASALHKDKYNYDAVNYVNTDTPVIISCPNHGEFSQIPKHHLKGSGCSVCFYESRRLNNSIFLEKAALVHGNKYDYSLVDYKSCYDELDIVCGIHGIFKQTAASHCNAQSGCPSCCPGGYSSNKSGYLYVFKSDDFVKVGITNKDPTIRMNDIIIASGFGWEVVESFYFQNGKEASDIETSILRTLRKNFKNPDKKFAGYSECFRNVPLELVFNLIHEEIFHDN